MLLLVVRRFSDKLDVSEIVFFVSSMGIITLAHMKKLYEITLVGNTGHYDNETVDFAGSGLGPTFRDARWTSLVTRFAGISLVPGSPGKNPL